MLMRAILFAITLIMAGASTPAADAQSPSGTIQLHIVRGSYFIGANGGHGVLYYQGHSYPISIGGASIGLSIGGSVADLSGEVYNLYSPHDIEGVYGAASASYALAHGQIGTKIHNSRGVILHLRGSQIGLEFSLDISGVALHLR